MFAGESPNGVWYSANDFATAEHCGTHLDAPYHFNKNGRKVADIPLDRLITKGSNIFPSGHYSGQQLLGLAQLNHI